MKFPIAYIKKKKMYPLLLMFFLSPVFGRQLTLLALSVLYDAL